MFRAPSKSLSQKGTCGSPTPCWPPVKPTGKTQIGFRDSGPRDEYQAPARTAQAGYTDSTLRLPGAAPSLPPKGSLH